MKDLQQVYIQIVNEETKTKCRIDRIDKTLESCDRLSADYWRDVRSEAVAYLNGLYIASDIVFKAIHK